MKKILFITIAMFFTSTFCFAQLLKSPAAPAAPATPARAAMKAPTSPTAQAQQPKLMAQMITGKVKSVSVADATKGAASNIVIMDSMGKDVTLAVLPSTVISKAGKQTTLDKIMQTESVRVQYIATPQGAKQALIIQVAG